MKNIFSIIIIFVACSSPNKTRIASNEENTSYILQNATTLDSKTHASEQKTNQIVQYGITYHLSENWTKTAESIKSIDRKGNLGSIQTNFEDSVNNATLQTIHHIGEKGKRLYNSKEKRIDNETTKTIQIADKKAIVFTEILTKNGKGKPIKPGNKRIIVSFLNQKNELIEFKFNVSLDNSEDSTNAFFAIISDIEFTK